MLFGAGGVTRTPDLLITKCIRALHLAVFRAFGVFPLDTFRVFQPTRSIVSIRSFPRVGQRVGQAPLALHRGFSNDNRAYSTALYVLKPYHLPNAAGDMALTLEDTARFGYVRQSGAVQSSEYSELY